MTSTLAVISVWFGLSAVVGFTMLWTFTTLEVSGWKILVGAALISVVRLLARKVE